MKIRKLEKVVKEVLETNIKSRNDNFVLVLEVYKKLEIPVKEEFMGLMIEHNKYELPSFESVVRSRRKVIEKYPQLQATEVVRELREDQKQMYIDYAIGGWK